MRTSALHPQSDGQVERQHQTIINYLAKFIKTRQIHFEIGQKIWLYNPRRVRGKAPKLQSRTWEGPYCVEKKLSDVVYCIRKSNRYKNKIVHTDRLATYLGRPVE
ncbi:hypothetical protein ALC57_07787 [Trachymyrmex cornetzi]|uniref:Integrase p58-like C-terminal domain-containing protein n=1 Tax=Trachymyrmex cornetzi TaxID=471704 RepID=A0A151J7M0_9HYME|nr:hypothetical protein ALC57_07787 [Trachymyrmex cornetzi]